MRKNTIYCNICGRSWTKVNDIIKKDFLMIRKDWGYFSNKDGIRHEIIICEECYDEWIKQIQ